MKTTTHSIKDESENEFAKTRHMDDVKTKNIKVLYAKQ